MTRYFKFYAGSIKDLASEIEKKGVSISSERTVLEKKREEYADLEARLNKMKKNLISKCLCLDSNNRIKVLDALHHPFFKSDSFEDINEEINLTNSNVSNNNTNINSDSLSYTSNKKANKLYDAIIYFIINNYYGKKRLEKLKEIFLNIDLDFDGKINKEDLTCALKSNWAKSGVAQINIILNVAEFDENGFIDFYQFIKSIIDKDELLNDNYLKLYSKYLFSFLYIRIIVNYMHSEFH